MSTAQATVERMLDDGVTFENVEAYIEGRRDLRAPQKSALWLLAFSEAKPQERRNAVREVLNAPDVELRPRHHGRTVTVSRRRRR